MTQQQHRRLALLCLTAYTVIGSIPSCNVVVDYILWFSVLYLLASYIRLYGFLPKLTTAHWAWLSLLCIAFSAATVIALRGGATAPYRLVTDCNTIGALLPTIATFMLFKDLHIPHSRLINTIGATIFGVLCIHAANDTMRQWLWHDTLDCTSQYLSDHLVLTAFGSVIAVFAVCSLLDFIRLRLVEPALFRYVVDPLLARHVWK